MKLSSSEQMKFGAILSYLSIFINIFAGVIYTPWMIEQIGKGDYGLYTLANSLITLFLVDFGLASATSRYISKYRAEDRQDKIDDFLGVIYKLYLIIDLLIFTVLIIIYFFIDKIYVKLTPTELEKFKVVYIIAASFAIINFPFVTFNGILNSHEKFVQLKFADVLYRTLIIAFTVTALFLGLGLYAIVTVNAVVGLIIILYKFIVIKKSTEIKINWKFNDKSLYKEIFSFSIWVTVSVLAARLVFNITPSILGIVASSSAIAVFGIVNVIEGYTYTLTDAINGMFMPKISRIYERGEREKNIMPLMINVGRFQYAIGGLVLIGFLTVGKEFICLWMDETYIEAYYGIILVVTPGLFYNSLQIANTTMIVEKKVKLQAMISLITGLTNVAFSFVFSYFWGIIGACISICLAYILRIIVCLFVYNNIMKLNIPLFIKKCYVKMTRPILIAVIFGLIINKIYYESGWLELVIKGVMITVIYLISIFFVGLNRNEQKAIINLIKNRVR